MVFQSKTAASQVAGYRVTHRIRFHHILIEGKKTPTNKLSRSGRVPRNYYLKTTSLRTFCADREFLTTILKHDETQSCGRISAAVGVADPNVLGSTSDEMVQDDKHAINSEAQIRKSAIKTDSLVSTMKRV